MLTWKKEASVSTAATLCEFVGVFLRIRKTSTGRQSPFQTVGFGPGRQVADFAFSDRPSFTAFNGEPTGQMLDPLNRYANRPRQFGGTAAVSVIGS